MDTVDGATVARSAEREVDGRGGGAVESEVEVSGASGAWWWFGDEHQTVRRSAVRAVTDGYVDIGPFRERLRRWIALFYQAADFTEDAVETVAVVVGGGHPAEVESVRPQASCRCSGGAWSDGDDVAVFAA